MLLIKYFGCPEAQELIVSEPNGAQMICRRGLADSFVATALIEPDFINGIGHKRTSVRLSGMSALPPKADIEPSDHNVRL